MKTEIRKRKFDALNYPYGSEERAKMNEDVLTSEYMPSYKYVLFAYHAETDTQCEYVSKYNFRTKKEAVERENELSISDNII